MTRTEELLFRCSTCDSLSLPSEDARQLVELVLLQHETLLELEPYIPANVKAIEAFNKWENGK